MTLPVYVSMTTIASRLGNLVPVLHSLLDQSRPADRLIINYSSRPYLLDEGLGADDFPDAVRTLAAQGRIELREVANHGPWRKLVPTLRRFVGREFLVATVDDDVRYPVDWLAELIRTHERHDAASAYRCRRLAFGDLGLAPYAKWRIADPRAMDPGADPVGLFPTGRGGILYHARHFPDLDLLDRLRPLAPAQDDLAFRWATLAAGVPVALADFRRAGAERLEFPGLRNRSELFHANMAPVGALSENDLAWNRLCDFFSEWPGMRDLAARLRIGG